MFAPASSAYHADALLPELRGLGSNKPVRGRAPRSRTYKVRASLSMLHRREAEEGVEPPSPGFADPCVAILPLGHKPTAALAATSSGYGPGTLLLELRRRRHGRGGSCTHTAERATTALAGLRLYRYRPPGHRQKRGGYRLRVVDRQEEQVHETPRTGSVGQGKVSRSCAGMVLYR